MSRGDRGSFASAEAPADTTTTTAAPVPVEQPQATPTTVIHDGPLQPYGSAVKVSAGQATRHPAALPFTGSDLALAGLGLGLLGGGGFLVWRARKLAA